jgi:hypothetical protein
MWIYRMKKSDNAKSLYFITTLILSAMLLSGVSAAYAAEVPEGVTEVKIPLAIEAGTESAIAGAEIAFTQSGGLEYVRFEPAGGAENPVESASGGNRWVGFFSAANKYGISDGSLEFGSLVFRYGGSAPENVTIAETRLHSLTGVGSEVRSVRGRPGTVIPVTRKNPGGTGDEGPVVVPVTPTAPNGPTAPNTPAAPNAPNAPASGDEGRNGNGGKGNSGKGRNGNSGKGENGNSGKGNSDNSGNSVGKSGSAGGGNAGNSNADGSGTGADSDSAQGANSSTDAGAGIAVADGAAAPGSGGGNDLVPFSESGELTDAGVPLANTDGSAYARDAWYLTGWKIATLLVALALAGLFLAIVRNRRRKRAANRRRSEVK